MERQASEGEILSLTSIRGIAAFWVVIFHFWPVILALAPEASMMAPLVTAGSFAVPLFFILSGYVLGLRYGTKLGSPTFRAVAKFWWLRLGRVYPVHAFTLLLSLALVARRGWPTDEGHSVGSFVANCLLIHAWDYTFHLSWNYPAWSISSEWFAYLILPLVAVPLARAGRRSAAFVLVLAGTASAGVYALENDLIFKGIAVVVPTFIGGMALAVLCPPAPAPKKWPWAEMVICAVVLLTFLAAAGPVQSALLLVLFFGLVAALGAKGHQSFAFWRSKPLVYLGEISYSMYMTHVIAITLLTRFAWEDEFTEQSVFVRVGLVCAGLGAILGAAVAVYYCVEQPLRTLSRRWAAPATNAAAVQAGVQPAAAAGPAVKQEISCVS